MRTAAALILALAMLTPAAPMAEEEDACEGRNPIHCGKQIENEAGDSIALMPPGGCAGRNPRYCQEEEPAVEPDADRQRKRGRNPGSVNPNRNPRRGGGAGG